MSIGPSASTMHRFRAIPYDALQVQGVAAYGVDPAGLVKEREAVGEAPIHGLMDPAGRRRLPGHARARLDLGRRAGDLSRSPGARSPGWPRRAAARAGPRCTSTACCAPPSTSTPPRPGSGGSYSGRRGRRRARTRSGSGHSATAAWASTGSRCALGAHRAGGRPPRHVLAHLVGGAAVVHRTPPPAPVLAQVEEVEPTRGAALDAIERAVGQELERRVDHRPQRSRQVVVRPAPLVGVIDPDGWRRAPGPRPRRAATGRRPRPGGLRRSRSHRRSGRGRSASRAPARGPREPRRDAGATPEQPLGLDGTEDPDVGAPGDHVAVVAERVVFRGPRPARSGC